MHVFAWYKFTIGRIYCILKIIDDSETAAQDGICFVSIQYYSAYLKDPYG